jgi:hypothetical protein
MAKTVLSRTAEATEDGRDGASPPTPADYALLVARADLGSPTAKAIMLVLASRADADGCVTIPHGALMDLTGIHAMATLTRWLRHLERRSFLSIKVRSEGPGPNTYQVSARRLLRGAADAPHDATAMSSRWSP